MRPNRGWELQEAPVLLPAERFVGALGAAAESGVLAGDPVDVATISVCRSSS